MTNLASLLMMGPQHPYGAPMVSPERSLAALLSGQVSMPMTLPELLMYKRQLNMMLPQQAPTGATQQLQQYLRNPVHTTGVRG